jgi:hypothetical protein
MKQTILFFSFLIIFTNSLIAGEVDQFTTRFVPIEDSSEIINKIANEYLEKSIQEANAEDAQCSEKVLYKKMRNYFANHKDGEITIFALESSLVKKIKLKISESIFKYWSINTGYLIGKKSADLSDVALSPLIKMGDQVIGTDKLEHLFGRGFAYFTNYYLKNKTLEQTLKKGIFEEKTIYGGNILATGVFSYADLAANFNGMRFWNHVLLKRDDIMGKTHNLGPYVLCENNKFKLNKRIDFRLYYDAAHDEGINCSKFATQKGLDGFNQSLQELAHKDTSHTYHCPMDINLLNAAIKKYGEFSKYIINSEGNSTVCYFSEFHGIF